MWQSLCPEPGLNGPGRAYPRPGPGCTGLTMGHAPNCVTWEMIHAGEKAWRGRRSSRNTQYSTNIWGSYRGVYGRSTNNPRCKRLSVTMRVSCLHAPRLLRVPKCTVMRIKGKGKHASAWLLFQKDPKIFAILCCFFFILMNISRGAKYARLCFL